MYVSTNKLDKELINYVFIECAGWSVIMDLKWILLKNNSNLWDAFKVENFLKKNKAVRFVYQHVGTGGPFLLIGYDYTNSITDIVDVASYEAVIVDWATILDQLASDSWEFVDFNDCILRWDIGYQQCVGEFIDALTGGIVSFVPSNWGALAKSNNWKSDMEKSEMLISANFKRFSDWQQLFSPGVGTEFTIEFITWYDEKFLKNN